MRRIKTSLLLMYFFHMACDDQLLASVVRGETQPKERLQYYSGKYCTCKIAACDFLAFESHARAATMVRDAPSLNEKAAIFVAF